MKPHSLIAGVALLAASLTLGPPRALAAEAGPVCPEAWRWRTPLGTFELDPEVRARLKELERSLREAARELRALLAEKARLSPEEEERLRRLLESLREQLRQLEGPQDEDLEHV